MTATASSAEPRRWRRRLLRFAAVACLGYALPVLAGCMNATSPVDYVMNLGSPPFDADLAVPDDGVRRVVVLRHGLFRSAGAMWKMERALRDHGYEVVNRSYDSTRGLIEEHAARLQREVEIALGNGDPRPLELYFVGHSLGGLQVRYYLSMPGARQPTACVYLGTPHRGALLIDKRKEWLLFPLLMGSGAALQLSPGSGFFAQLRPPACPTGNLYGGRGDGEGSNDAIPGDDDGSVGVDEAQLPGATDRVCLPLGHTSISMADEAVRQVLHFLRHRRFAR